MGISHSLCNLVTARRVMWCAVLLLYGLLPWWVHSVLQIDLNTSAPSNHFSYYCFSTAWKARGFFSHAGCTVLGIKTPLQGLSGFALARDGCTAFAAKLWSKRRYCTLSISCSFPDHTSRVWFAGVFCPSAVPRLRLVKKQAGRVPANASYSRR